MLGRVQEHDVETPAATAAAAVERTTRAVRGVHAAVARRVFAAIGPVGVPASLLNDRIASAAYGSVEAGHAWRGGGASPRHPPNRQA